LSTRATVGGIVVPELELNVQREFQFSDEDFDKVRSLIHGRAGIALSPSKREMVYSRLARRLRELRMASFRAYLGLLANDTHPEWENFVNALTTNLTSFFRESHHFPILAEHLKARARSGEPIELWCSASSTGEEPYSMAMTVLEAFPGGVPQVRITATDVDTQVLAFAERGIYPADRVEKLPPERVRRFFLRGTNEQAGSVRVRPELRAMIRFSKLNLLDRQLPLKSRFDAIFCRNVMIYFDRPTQRAIIQKFVPLLKPDGLLFAGHSESLHHCADLFRLRGRTVYELADGRV